MLKYYVQIVECFSLNQKWSLTLVIVIIFSEHLTANPTHVEIESTEIKNFDGFKKIAIANNKFQEENVYECPIINVIKNFSLIINLGIISIKIKFLNKF